MKRTATPWTVGDEGIRPAGKPDRCFYCDEPKYSFEYESPYPHAGAGKRVQF